MPHLDTTTFSHQFSLLLLVLIVTGLFLSVTVTLVISLASKVRAWSLASTLDLSITHSRSFKDLSPTLSWSKPHSSLPSSYSSSLSSLLVTFISK